MIFCYTYSSDVIRAPTRVHVLPACPALPFKSFSPQEKRHNLSVRRAVRTGARAETMSRTLLFPLLLLLLLCGSSAGEPQTPVAVEEYYIAAVEIGWDYIHLDDASEQR